MDGPNVRQDAHPIGKHTAEQKEKSGQHPKHMAQQLAPGMGFSPEEYPAHAQFRSTDHQDTEHHQREYLFFKRHEANLPIPKM